MSEPNFGELMKKAQEMQKKMQWAQQKLAAMEVHGEAGAGMVVVTMNGKYECKNIKLDPELLKQPVKVVEDLTVAAINVAVGNVEALLKKEMHSLTKDLGIPE